MNENNQLKAFIAFLFIFTVMALSQTVSAAVSMTPAVAGYSSGSYSAAAGSFTTAANAASYGASGIVNVGGKAVTVPATLRMASNAGQYVKNAMRLNPWAIAGTLAAGYLLDQGVEYLNGQWQRGTIQDYPISSNCPFTGMTCGYVGPLQPGDEYTAAYNSCVGSGGDGLQLLGSNYVCVFSGAYQPTTAPLDLPAWDALPDPLSVVAPELPYVPYMPEGVPVEAPEYDFAPLSVPVGNPYTKPDGSTAQPMAKVSPNGDSVTVDTYDQPLTDSTGAPVPPDTPPVDTVEPPPPPQTDCDKYPKSIGCSEYGELPVSDIIPTYEVPVSTAFTPVGGNGSCPADVSLMALGSSLTWSYGPICGFAETIRPLVIGFAWLSFGFTVVSGFRKA